MYCDDLLDQFGVDRKMGSIISKIASLTKKHGEGLYVSNDSLAKMIKMSPRTVRRWLTVLSDKGVLAVQYLSSVSRKIFFTEKFAKCLNNIIGGGLSGASVPKQYSKEAVCKNFPHDCPFKSNMDNHATNKYREIFSNIKLGNTITKNSIDQVKYNYRKERKEIINSTDIRFTHISPINYKEKKENNLLIGNNSNFLRNLNHLINRSFSNIKNAINSLNNQYFAKSKKQNLDCSTLNCQKDENKTVKFNKTLEDFWGDIEEEKEKEKSSAKKEKEKEKEIWEHVNAVAEARLGHPLNQQHVNEKSTQDEESEPQLSEVNQSPFQSYMHENAREKMMLISSPACTLLNEHQLRIVRDFGDCSNDTDLSEKQKEHYATVRGYAIKRLEEIERERAEKEADKNALIERERYINDSDPDGLHPAVRAEVNKILKDLESLQVFPGNLIPIAKSITRVLINNPDEDPTPLMNDAFKKYYSMIQETNS